MPPIRRLHLESLMRGEILGLAGPRSIVSTILATSKAVTLGVFAAEITEPSQLLKEMVF